MFRYSTILIHIVSFIISIFIFFSIQLFISNAEFITVKSGFKAGFQVEEKTQINPNHLIEQTEIEKKQQDWYLEIPNLSLKANIQEGTTKEVLDQYIGHFEETSMFSGNVGLAAHNRGYPQNYFENIKKLKEGDSIFYQYQGKRKEYVVTKNFIIDDTDWTCLEATEENTITLITCVENQPQYRRCIQGKEKEREEV